MINPFSEDLSIREELREAWKKIEHLEEENKKLKESQERLLKYVRELEKDLGFHRLILDINHNKEGYYETTEI